MGVILVSGIYLLVQNQPIRPPATPLPVDCQVLIPAEDALNLQAMAALDNVYEQLGTAGNPFALLTPTPIPLPGGCGTTP